ncbi:MAG TPA: helicase-associated domain-containing protein [Pseudonocardiaceae bacterium]
MARKVETPIAALIALLRQMDADELTALLTARPDVTATPEPRNISELATRLGNDYSMRTALCQLTVPQIKLAEVLQVLGDGRPRADLERLLGVGEFLERGMLEELLDGLRRLALAWTEGAVLRIAPGMDRFSALPLLLGPPVAQLMAGLSVEQLSQIATNLGIPGQRRKPEWLTVLAGALSDPRQLRAALESAPPGIDETLKRLVWHNPRVHGPVQVALHRFASYGLTPEISWLAQRGFLLPSGWDEGQMPREVALALRGEDYHPVLSAVPPVLVTRRIDPAPVARVSIVDGMQRMLASLGISPAQQLAAGGVGVRELRRIGKALNSTESEVRLWLELAAAAGMVAPAGDGGLLPTTAADAWLAEPPGAQLASLITAWQTIGAVPSHRVNADGKSLSALDPDGFTRIGPPLRTDLLRLLADSPAGTAVTDLDSLIDVLAWRYPLRYHSAEALGPYLVATWNEAQHLGLVVDATLSSLGRMAATSSCDEDLAELAAQIMPAPVDRATFLPDLTAVVSGPPTAELAGLLDAVADQESRDTASTWRLSPGSVRRALDSGHTADELLARLAEVAERPLPQPVEYLVNDAARRHGQLQVRVVSCAVSTSDPGLAAEIAANRKLGALELAPLAATVLGSGKPAAETLRLLRAAGYSPVRQSKTGQTVVERVAPQRAPQLRLARQPIPAAAAVAPAALARRLASSTMPVAGRP